MKRCPTCYQTYTDDTLSFCLEDGGLLTRISEPAGSYDPNATARYPQPRSTEAPTEVYRTDTPLINQVAMNDRPQMPLPDVGRSMSASPKAVMALVFGVMGFIICGLFGIGGIIIGRQELRAIEAGQSPVAGTGFARAGVICGWISLGLMCVTLFFFFISFVLSAAN
ncbi:MAG TPA: DUF4190 domain-containing protein [Pyrinomonadaceae bacterium]|jgi:hypothetical protein